MVTRQELVAHLDALFGIPAALDISYNGLQFEGAQEVTVVATGVDAGVLFFQAARKVGAQFAIVHHGLFWKGKEWRRIDRFARRAVYELNRGDLSLYACHLPLDSHPELGNNACLARALGVEVTGLFGEMLGQKIGCTGRLPRPLSVTAFRKRCENAIGPVLHHIGFGPDRIREVGIVSGGGWDAVTDPLVANGQVQALVTGEVVHQAVAPCRERGIHLFACGHYATETLGLKALGEHLARAFRLRHRFIDLPTGL